MANISFDNGASWLDPDGVLNYSDIDYIPRMWGLIIRHMDGDTREAVNADLAPCTHLEFLAEYLRRTTKDIIIG